MTIILRLIAIVGLLSTTTLSVSDAHVKGTPVVSEDLEQTSTVREVTVRARRYAFRPARIEVNQGDIVKITLIAEDVPHSFTIDEYRISKRASPERSVTFEFCADKPGRFVFYCNLTSDEGCREMRGEFLVR
jgi:heme/copper-type cytochrome/quinol oxidase subunit 2